MKTKPCIGYAPVVDGEIWGCYFHETKSETAMDIRYNVHSIDYKIIKVEIRPVKIPRKKKAAKRTNKQMGNKKKVRKNDRQGKSAGGSG